jgi:hypothetical protein
MHWVVVVGAQLISTSSRQQLPTLEARNDRQMHDGLHLHERVPPAAPSEEPARNQQTKLARAAYVWATDCGGGARAVLSDDLSESVVAWKNEMDICFWSKLQTQK